jgi:hypothetical protein
LASNFICLTSLRDSSQADIALGRADQAVSYQAGFATLEQAMITRQLGTISSIDQAALKKAIASILK